MPHAMSDVFKRHVTTRKKIEDDTGWKSGPMPPKSGPYPHRVPARPRWEWRSLSLSAADGGSYRLLLQAAPALAKWKAWLILTSKDGEPCCVARLEDQPGGKCGLHVHAHCDGNPEVSGAESIEMLYRLPEHGRFHRRRSAWTKAQFGQMAGRVFRTDPVTGQEDLF